MRTDMNLKFMRRVSERELACKQALRTGYSEICFRMAGPLAIRKQISE